MKFVDVKYDVSKLPFANGEATFFVNIELDGNVESAKEVVAKVEEEVVKNGWNKPWVSFLTTNRVQMQVDVSSATSENIDEVQEFIDEVSRKALDLQPEAKGNPFLASVPFIILKLPANTRMGELLQYTRCMYVETSKEKPYNQIAMMELLNEGSSIVLIKETELEETKEFYRQFLAAYNKPRKAICVYKSDEFKQYCLDEGIRCVKEF